VSEATQAPTEATYDAAEEFLEPHTVVQRLQSTLHRYPWLSPAVVLVASVIVFGLLNPNFATPNNLSLITQQVAVVGALAVGQTLIILTAGIDLSNGAIMVFSSMVMAKTAFDSGIPGWLALLLGLVVGTLAGGVNGLLVTKVRLPPFIVTLGTLNVFVALTLLYATGRTIRDTELAPVLAWLGKTFSIGGVRVTTGVLVMLLMYAAFAYVLRFTSWGRHVYAVGDDAEAARLAGIQGAKRTPDLVPLCHPIALHGVTVDLTVEDDGVRIAATVRTADRTGVEMEALTAVSVAALALVDMVKAVDPAAVVTDVQVDEKTGGAHGDWRRAQ